MKREPSSNNPPPVHRHPDVNSPITEGPILKWTVDHLDDGNPAIYILAGKYISASEGAIKTEPTKGIWESPSKIH